MGLLSYGKKGKKFGQTIKSSSKNLVKGCKKNLRIRGIQIIKKL